MEPILTILIASLVQRSPLLQRLLDTINCQSGLHYTEVLVAQDAGELPTGTKRQNLVDQAHGIYCIFIDDDDLIPLDYISVVLQVLEDKPDVVGYQIPCEMHNVKSILYKRGKGDPANHTCVWRTELARRVPWLPIWRADDYFWTEAQWRLITYLKQPINLVYLDRPMYFYHRALNGQRFFEAKHSDETTAWAQGGVEAFVLQEQVAMAAMPDNLTKARASIPVYTRAGLAVVERSSLTSLGVIPYGL